MDHDQESQPSEGSSVLTAVFSTRNQLSLPPPTRAEDVASQSSAFRAPNSNSQWLPAATIGPTGSSSLQQQAPSIIAAQAVLRYLEMQDRQMQHRLQNMATQSRRQLQLLFAAHLLMPGSQSNIGGPTHPNLLPVSPPAQKAFVPLTAKSMGQSQNQSLDESKNEELAHLVQRSVSSSTSNTPGAPTRPDLVPCRARGMPSDHDYQNAHFTINSDAVKHGEELHCSHSACRASGIKFCFCAYCAIPVAKRNFRIRHHHCEETPLPTAGSDVYERLVREEAQATPTAPPASWEINDGNNQVEPPVRNSFPPSPGDSSHNRAFLAPRRMDSSGNTDNFPTVQSQSGQVKFGGQNGQETTPTAAVPCRARRGMPPDHNSDTAVFIIPTNTSHGEDLIFSDKKCRDAGPKFRLCVHCAIPVARRNFHLRHAHCRVSSSSPRQSSLLLSGSSASRTNTEELTTDTTSLSGDEESSRYIVSSMVSEPMETTELRARTDAEWDMLLERRPPRDNKEEMAVWMKRVLAVSSEGLTSPASHQAPLYEYMPHERDLSNLIKSTFNQYVVARISSGDNASSSSKEQERGEKTNKRKRHLS